MSTEEFEQELDRVYKQYRHSELDEKLEDIADIMEEIILQKVLAEAIFECDFEISRKTKKAVQEMNKYLENNDLEKVEEEIDDLKEAVEEDERRVNVQIQGHRTEMLDIMSGITRLNQRLERIDEKQLAEVNELLKEWNWKDHIYDDTTESDIEDLKKQADNYGKNIYQSISKAKNELYGQYKGTELEKIVDSLLNEERLALDNLTDEQLERLRDSELEKYIELSLS